MFTKQQLEEQFGDTDIVGSSLEERKGFIGEVIEKAGDNIANAILGNPFARTSDVTSFVETPMGATGFTDDNKKVSDLTDTELNFLRERNEEKLRSETGFGMPSISGSRDNEAQFKLFDPKQAFLTGDGSTGIMGNRAAQNALMQQTIDGQPIGELLAKQIQAESRAPSMASIASLAASASPAEQKAFLKAGQEREARLAQREAAEDLAERQRSSGMTAKAFKEMEEAKLKAESAQNSLADLNPTQLTYLLGQLGYDITPKAKEENNLAELPTLNNVTELPTLDSAEGQAILQKVKKANRNVSEAALIAELRAKNKIA